MTHENGHLPHDDRDIIPMVADEAMSSLLKHRSAWLVEREARIQKGIDAELDILDAIEEIRQHPDEYKRLGFARFQDYFQARWGRTVSNYYHKAKQIKWWKDIMLPALTDTGVECTTVHMPTERTFRPSGLLAKPPRYREGNREGSGTGHETRFESC